MTPDKFLYTAHATSTGGRNGIAQTDDGIVVHRPAQATCNLGRSL